MRDLCPKRTPRQQDQSWTQWGKDSHSDHAFGYTPTAIDAQGRVYGQNFGIPNVLGN